MPRRKRAERVQKIYSDNEETILAAAVVANAVNKGEEQEPPPISTTTCAPSETQAGAAVASKIVSAVPIKTGLWGGAPSEVVDSRLRQTPILDTKAECEQIPLAAVDLRSDLEAAASPPDVDTFSTPWSSSFSPSTPAIAHEEIPETPEIEVEEDNGTWSDSIDTNALLRSMIAQNKLHVDVKGRHIIENSYVEFAIEVTEKPSETIVVAVYRRYQDFASLNADLASLRRLNNAEPGPSPLPKFPPKSGIPKLFFSQWRSDSFLATRQQQLSDYIQQVLHLCSSDAERARLVNFLSPSS